MNYISLVVTPLLGAVIGYFTNWLAIKMLFRPHTKKYLFGVPLPFTPGLIPKERFVLSKKVGETLTKNVLTETVIKNSVLSPSMLKTLENNLDKLLDSLRHNEETLGCTAEKKLGNEFQKNKELFNHWLFTLIQNNISKEVLQQKLLPPLMEKLNELLQSKESSQWINSFFQTNFEKLLESEKKLSDCLPESLIIGLKQLGMEKIGNMPLALSGFLDKNPQMEDKLRLLVAQIAEENFGKFVGLFVSYNKIYDSIKENLLVYLAEPENQKLIVAYGETFLDKLLDTEISVLAKKLTQKSQTDLLNNLAQTIKPLVSEKSEAFVLRSLDVVYLIAEREFKQHATVIFNAIEEKVLQMKVSDLFSRISDKHVSKLRNWLLTIFVAIVEKYGKSAVQTLNISTMVEDKINDFSVTEAEELIISVVDRELNMITVLGGVLGFVIGFVPAIINLFV